VPRNYSEWSLLRKGGYLELWDCFLGNANQASTFPRLSFFPSNLPKIETIFIWIITDIGIDSMALIFQIGSRNLHPPIPSDCPKAFIELMEVLPFPSKNKNQDKNQNKHIPGMLETVTQREIVVYANHRTSWCMLSKIFEPGLNFFCKRKCPSLLLLLLLSFSSSSSSFNLCKIARSLEERGSWQL